MHFGLYCNVLLMFLVKILEATEICPPPPKKKKSEEEKRNEPSGPMLTCFSPLADTVRKTGVLENNTLDTTTIQRAK